MQHLHILNNRKRNAELYSFVIPFTLNTLHNLALTQIYHFVSFRDVSAFHHEPLHQTPPAHSGHRAYCGSERTGNRNPATSGCNSPGLQHGSQRRHTRAWRKHRLPIQSPLRHPAPRGCPQLPPHRNLGKRENQASAQRRQRRTHA